MTKTSERKGPIYHQLVLDSIDLHMIELIDGYTLKNLTRSEPRICEHADAVEFRRTLRGYGKRSRQTMRCPSTWWQHLKLALRTRWPRLFGRIAVHFDEVSVETGVLVDGLPAPVRARHLIISYTMDPKNWSYVDDPKDPDQ
jgi:hypothetical protein